MSAQPRIMLDLVGDAFVPDGFILIETETEFLRQALTKANLFIRGKMICRWADTFYRGRGIPFVVAASPRNALCDAVPALTDEQSSLLVNQIGQRFTELCQPVTAIDVLELLYPDGPWHPVPSLHHAAEWLLWLSDQQFSAYISPVIIAQVSRWQTDCAEEEARYYVPQTPPEATLVLRQWLGIAERENKLGWKRFPLAIPVVWQQIADQEWRQQVMLLGGMLFEQVVALDIPPDLADVAAQATFDYYKANPGKLTRKMVNALAGHLSPKDAASLQRLCPQPDPGDLPVTPEAIFSWFAQRYLPYRQWQVSTGDTDAGQRVSHLAAKFAEWCLDYYPGALSSGKPSLSISHAAALQQTREDYVTLWVVLDGLHFADAQTLSDKIGKEQRLTLTMRDVTLAPLPTITHFCKKALLYGQPPAMVESRSLDPDFPGAKSLPVNKDPVPSMRQAQHGDIFVWRIEEPDKTYHKPFDRKTLLDKVSNQLQYLAERITQAALAIPGHLNVRVVIATDHGRLLSAGTRSHTIPAGMSTHGRAAYGPSGQNFGPKGYLVQESEQIAYLNSSRFRLPTDCAVALDVDSFLTNDGGSGIEQFSHGGLFPEEVLVPWLEFARDWVAPMILCRVSGNAVAGRSGMLRLALQHTGKVAVTAMHLKIDWGSVEPIQLSVDEIAPPMTETRIDVPMHRWPTADQCQKAAGTVTFTMPNGRTFEREVSFDWSSEELYKTEIDADDLLSLGE